MMPTNKIRTAPSPQRNQAMLQAGLQRDYAGLAGVPHGRAGGSGAADPSVRSAMEAQQPRLASVRGATSWSHTDSIAGKYAGSAMRTGYGNADDEMQQRGPVSGPSKRQQKYAKTMPSPERRQAAEKEISKAVEDLDQMRRASVGVKQATAEAEGDPDTVEDGDDDDSSEESGSPSPRLSTFGQRLRSQDQALGIAGQRRTRPGIAHVAAERVSPTREDDAGQRGSEDDKHVERDSSDAMTARGSSASDSGAKMTKTEVTKTGAEKSSQTSGAVGSASMKATKPEVETSPAPTSSLVTATSARKTSPDATGSITSAATEREPSEKSTTRRAGAAVAAAVSPAGSGKAAATTAPMAVNVTRNPAMAGMLQVAAVRADVSDGGVKSSAAEDVTATGSRAAQDAASALKKTIDAFAQRPGASSTAPSVPAESTNSKSVAQADRRGSVAMSASSKQAQGEATTGPETADKTHDSRRRVDSTKDEDSKKTPSKAQGGEAK